MSKSASLVQPLFPGPLDLIGDVHGELATLEALLKRLGYRDGTHPAGRRLVFLGDLVDRGPDSPGVVRFVQGLVESGRAQCILGNHELNILRKYTRVGKEGSGWFFENAEERDENNVERDGNNIEMPQETVPEDPRKAYADFFESLPLALVRDDLRVVHACWDDEAVKRAREENSALDLYRSEERLIRGEIAKSDLADEADREKKTLKDDGFDLRNSQVEPPFQLAIGQVAVCEQHNAVKMLTSGPEMLVEPGKPFFVGGKWRMTTREPWWDSYDEGVTVVVGHYWRSAGGGGMATKDGEPDPMEGVEPEVPLGDDELVHVIDYSVGLGYRRRNDAKFTGDLYLAALRWPAPQAGSTTVPWELVLELLSE
jgi:hypothetical protein